MTPRPSRRQAVASMLAALAAPPQARAEAVPGSIHTWFEGMRPEIYSVDVDLRFDRLPARLDPDWLYFASLQVDFDSREEWGHGGLQWAAGGRKVNWGGGSDAGYGLAADGSGNSILEDFDWAAGRWYRYRVWRVERGADGLWYWLFTVMDRETGAETQVGTLRTVSEWIGGAVVWIETGYGVACDTDPVVVSWRSPVYRCTVPGEHVPGAGTATYNGTCEGALGTDQRLVAHHPLEWRQATGTRRTTPAGARLWG